MPSFRHLLNDTVFIVKPGGARLGPFMAAVSSDSITLIEKMIDVDEGDHVAREIPSGKEEIYLILSVNYRPGLHSIPPSYTLKVHKTTELPARSTDMKSTTINIHNSTGVQVGDYNTQQIQATFNELVQRIDKSSGSPEAKAEAKGRLAAFLEHPLVTSVLGGVASAVLAGL